VERVRSGHFGYTLWEVLLVLFLLGIIAAMINPHFSTASEQVQKRVDAANRQMIEGAALLYQIDVGQYPSTMADLLVNPGENGWQGPYLDKEPLNPFNPEHGYVLGNMGKVQP